MLFWQARNKKNLEKIKTSNFVSMFISEYNIIEKKKKYKNNAYLE